MVSVVGEGVGWLELSDSSCQGSTDDRSRTTSTDIAAEMSAQGDAAVAQEPEAEQALVQAEAGPAGLTTELAAPGRPPEQAAAPDDAQQGQPDQPSASEMEQAPPAPVQEVAAGQAAGSMEGLAAEGTTAAEPAAAAPEGGTDIGMVDAAAEPGATQPIKTEASGQGLAATAGAVEVPAGVAAMDVQEPEARAPVAPSLCGAPENRTQPAAAPGPATAMEVEGSQEPMSPTGIRQYLDTTVVPVLRLGLRELVKARPTDPFDFLADFIKQNKPK